MCRRDPGAQPAHATLDAAVGMQTDVDRLVARAGEMDRLWPWMAADREIDRVVRHGKAVAPLLVAFLAEDPHEPPLEMTDLRVQQHAALALCRIYKVSEQCGHVYCNRETREGNKGVRRFWLEKASEQTNPPRDKRPPQEAHSGDKIAQDRQRIGGATTQ